MNDLSSSVYVKEWIIVFIVNKLILIYFTWFVHNFVNYKYNVLLKRNDVCLMPLSTFVCVSRPFAVKASSVWNSWNIREQIKDVVLKTFLSSAKSLHRYFRMKHRAFLTSHFNLFTLEAGKATN